MKVQKEMFVHWRDEYVTGQEWNLFGCDMSAYGHVCVGKQTVEFEVPDDFNPVSIQLEMLNKEKERVTREFNDRIEAIKREISKLQCIGYAEVV